MRKVIPAVQYIAIALGDEAPAVAAHLLAVVAALTITAIFLLRLV